MAIPRPNRRAVGTMVRALKAGGRLEGVDAGVAALARASADLLDEALAYQHEKMYAVSGHMRVHLSILEALLGRTLVERPDDGFAQFLLAMSTPSPGLLGDAPED